MSEVEKSDSKASLGEDFWIQELVCKIFTVFYYFILLVASGQVQIQNLGFCNWFQKLISQGIYSHTFIVSNRRFQHYTFSFYLVSFKWIWEIQDRFISSGPFRTISQCHTDDPMLDWIQSPNSFKNRWLHYTENGQPRPSCEFKRAMVMWRQNTGGWLFHK